MTGRASASRRLLLAALLALGGCASLPPPPQVTGLVRSGRLAVQVAADGAEPARQWVSTFELRGDAAEGALELTSPLGTTLARAHWDARGAELATPQATTRHENLDALARQMLGVDVPMAAWLDWVDARPWPEAVALSTDSGFDQLGWRIDLTRRDDGAIAMQRTTPSPAVTVRLRLDMPVR